MSLILLCFLLTYLSYLKLILSYSQQEQSPVKQTYPTDFLEYTIKIIYRCGLHEKEYFKSIFRELFRAAFKDTYVYVGRVLF